MKWKDLSTIDELRLLVEFEKTIFKSEDLSSVEDYIHWKDSKKMKFHVLTDLNDVIMGSFQVFEENDKIYMGGFGVAHNHRGTHVSNTLMRKLLHMYGSKEVICKTSPKNIPMKKLLKKFNFENNMDKFENGVLWSYWSYVLGNEFLHKKV